MKGQSHKLWRMVCALDFWSSNYFRMVAWAMGQTALLGWNAYNSSNISTHPLPGHIPSKTYPAGVPPELGDSQEAGPAQQKPSSQSTTGSSWSWRKSRPPPSQPSGGVDGELDWDWWSISLLVEWATGRVFSTRLQDGKASTGGGWAIYLADRTGLWCFGNYWPIVAWSVLALLEVGVLVGLAWAVRILRQFLCYCCDRRAGPPEPHVGPSPPVPAAAAALPSAEVY